MRISGDPCYVNINIIYDNKKLKLTSLNFKIPGLLISLMFKKFFNPSQFYKTNNFMKVLISKW